MSIYEGLGPALHLDGPVAQIPLKGQCHEIFNTFLSKKSTWTPYEQEKTVLQIFHFCEHIHKKRVSAESTTKLTPC